MNTNIDFNGHLLTLSYKKKDDGALKYSWTIHSEWSPEATDSVVPQTQKTSSAVGLTPTPVVHVDADTTLVITGLDPVDPKHHGDVIDGVKKILSEANVCELAKTIRVAGSKVIVKCDSKEDCKKVKQECKEVQLMGKRVTWTLESEA